MGSGGGLAFRRRAREWGCPGLGPSGAGVRRRVSAWGHQGLGLSGVGIRRRVSCWGHPGLALGEGLGVGTLQGCVQGLTLRNVLGFGAIRGMR